MKPLLILGGVLFISDGVCGGDPSRYVHSATGVEATQTDGGWTVAAQTQG